MRLFLRRLYFFYGVLVFTVCMVTFTSLILLTIAIVKDQKRAGHISYFFLRCWGFCFSSFCLVFYKIEGKENFNHQEAYIFACNHNSFLDGIAICLAIPNDFRPLGKVELLKIPVFGLMYKHVVILVNRNSMESKHKSMLTMVKKIKEGISILIFPEGTMNKGSDLLQPFMNGAFSLAIEVQRPIVPMIMHNSKKVMPRVPNYTLQPGIIKIKFLSPVSTSGLNKNDIDSLKSEVYLQIEKNLIKG
ncbi:MAG: 1-acyl-sn-glycerol-3-phosphate acyltransferase [Opitutaceae bacterium]|nr:1-acyl-sn-glycerol-3-phosphate acyltransferase [Cytophagales bacterium]